MRVMTLHEWFDEDVQYVSQEGHEDIREIGLKGTNDGALLISKEDVIALAKEFGLIVYLKGSNL